jgi:hypothetical protein
MRKGLLIILIIIVAYLSLTDSYDSKFIIPNEAIRLRVIPNSNSKHDQEIKTKVSKHLQYNINFGSNFFPKKEYNVVTYPEGYYESVKVTLGEGLGDNWWCIIFPPLCLIEAEESTEVEYNFFVKEIIKKYFRI